MTDKLRLLIGCWEPDMNKIITILLGDGCQVTERGRFHELGRDASAGDLHLVVIYAPAEFLKAPRSPSKASNRPARLLSLR